MTHELEVSGVSKTFGGVRALADAGIRVRAGTVHALLGENGAGKSTLIKVISGAVAPDTGSLSLHGESVSFSSTADAARYGVAVVSQELNLFGDLDLLANLYPMREPKRGPFLDRADMLAMAKPVLAELGLHADPRTLVSELSLAQRQLVEIAKALVTEPSVLILDEPTSALESETSERLLNILRVLRERDVAVVFVSHLLEEVMTLCDEITVLRDGSTVLDGVTRSDLDMNQVLTAMLGREQETARRDDTGRTGSEAAEPRDTLRLSDVSVPRRLHDVNFTAAPGEVLGLAGLAGSGHLGVLEVIAGLRKPAAGTVRLPGGRHAPRNLRKAIDSGVALVSGDRRKLGLMLDKPVWENIAQIRSVALARDGYLVRSGALRDRARRMTTELHIRTSSVDARCGLLSGGNQQKVVLAKWLQSEPSVILLDDPTRGVDVGGKEEIHTLLRSSAAQGRVVLLCSTDLDELVDVCDRVLVFHQGRVCADLSGTEVDQHTLLHAMNTGSPSGD